MNQRQADISLVAKRRAESMLALHQAGYTYRQIAARYGISYQRVHQVIAPARMMSQEADRQKKLAADQKWWPCCRTKRDGPHAPLCKNS